MSRDLISFHDINNRNNNKNNDIILENQYFDSLDCGLSEDIFSKSMYEKSIEDSSPYLFNSDNGYFNSNINSENNSEKNDINLKNYYNKEVDYFNNNTESNQLKGSYNNTNNNANSNYNNNYNFNIINNNYHNYTKYDFNPGINKINENDFYLSCRIPNKKLSVNSVDTNINSKHTNSNTNKSNKAKNEADNNLNFIKIGAKRDNAQYSSTSSVFALSSVSNSSNGYNKFINSKVNNINNHEILSSNASNYMSGTSGYKNKVKKNIFATYKAENSPIKVAQIINKNPEKFKTRRDFIKERNKLAARKSRNNKAAEYNRLYTLNKKLKEELEEKNKLIKELEIENFNLKKAYSGTSGISIGSTSNISGFNNRGNNNEGVYCNKCYMSILF